MKKQDAYQSQRTLAEELRAGTLRQIYLLYGSERFLRNFYFDRICKALGADPEDMNTSIFSGKNFTVGELMESGETLPFFADRRVVIVKESGLFKDGSEDLAKYLEGASETTTFLFLESEVNERKKLYKVVCEKGIAVELIEQSEGDLKKNIGAYLGKAGKRISSDTATYLLSRTGTDMGNLRNELEKLVCFCMDKEEITREDIDTICSRTAEDRVFEMLEAITYRDAKRSFAIYRDLLVMKEPAVKILTLMQRQYLWMLQLLIERAGGLSRDGIIAKYATAKKEIDPDTGKEKTIAPKIQSFQVGNYLRQASQYSEAQIQKALLLIATAEEDIKSGKMNETIALEGLITELVQSKKEET